MLSTSFAPPGDISLPDFVYRDRVMTRVIGSRADLSLSPKERAKQSSMCQVDRKGNIIISETETKCIYDWSLILSEIVTGGETLKLNMSDRRGKYFFVRLWRKLEISKLLKFSGNICPLEIARLFSLSFSVKLIEIFF